MKISPKYSQKQLAGGWLLFFLVAGLVLIFTTENSFGGGDHFTHFRMARWGWKYPYLLFNHWGKPVFTILISPFAQLGMNAARLFNLLAGLLTAFFAWRLSDELKFKNSWSVILLVVLTPVYFSLMFSVMTEVLHSLILVLALWLFFKKDYAWSAVAISFLPIARTESIVLIPIFLFAFALRKQWKTIPLMVTGFVIISLMGWPFYKGFWWLITEMPYQGSAAGIYGHGTLFHFINSTKGILGFPIAGLFVVGFVFSFWMWIKRDRFKINNRFFFLLLVPGIYLTYLAAHSVAWWKGLGNSLGLIRVLGAVSPLAAITALVGFNVLEAYFGKFNKVFRAFVILLLLWMLSMIYSDCCGGFKKSDPQIVLAKVTNYMDSHHLTKNKIYYFNNYILYKLQIDPYNNNLAAWGVPNAIKVSFCIPDSSIVVWDAHFGPNEGRTPLKKLLNDDGLKVLKVFKPEKPFTTLGGYNYEVYVFQKLEKQQEKTTLHLDFEQDEPDFSDARAFKGKKSYRVGKSKSFVNLVVNKVCNLCNSGCRVTISGAIFVEQPLGKKNVLIALSRSSERSAYYFKRFDLSEFAVAGQWKKFHYDILLKPPANDDEVVKVYFWNKNHKEFWVDEVEVKFNTHQN